MSIFSILKQVHNSLRLKQLLVLAKSTHSKTVNLLWPSCYTSWVHKQRGRGRWFAFTDVLERVTLLLWRVAALPHMFYSAVYFSPNLGCKYLHYSRLHTCALRTSVKSPQSNTITIREPPARALFSGHFVPSSRRCTVYAGIHDKYLFTPSFLMQEPTRKVSKFCIANTHCNASQ